MKNATLENPTRDHQSPDQTKPRSERQTDKKSSCNQRHHKQQASARAMTAPGGNRQGRRQTPDPHAAHQQSVRSFPQPQRVFDQNGQENREVESQNSHQPNGNQHLA